LLDGGLDAKPLDHGNGRVDLLAQPWRVCEEFVSHGLIKMHFSDFRTPEDRSFVAARQGKENAALAIRMKLVLVRILRQPMRPQAGAGTQDCVQPDAVP